MDNKTWPRLQEEEGERKRRRRKRNAVTYPDEEAADVARETLGHGDGVDDELLLTLDDDKSLL